MNTTRNVLLSGVVALVLTACGNSSSEKTVTHNDITYGLVTSPYTDRVWLDRNLGASQVCTSMTDSACFGDYYQWGRAYDGHQDPNSGKLDVKASTVDNVGDKFIITFTDWTSADSTGETRSANWRSIDGDSVCPAGFRVPTESEIRAEFSSDEPIVSLSDAYDSFLKIPSSGYRAWNDGNFQLTNNEALFWTSDIAGSQARFLHMQSGWYIGNNYRAYGFSIRCIEDNTL